MKTAPAKKALLIVLSLLLTVLYVPLLPADEDSGNVDMIVGDIQSVAVNGLSRVSVTNPDVADISDAQDNKVSLIAKKAGSTVLFLWDAGGKRSIRVRVASEDLGGLKARIQRIFSETNINGVTVDEDLDRGKLILTGELTKEDRDRMEDVLDPYSDELVDYVREQKSEDLVQVDMQIIEISTTLEESLGIDWGSTPANSAASAGGAPTTSGTVPVLQMGYNEQGVPFGDKFKDLFRVGNFERTSPLTATVNALVQEGKARLISKPRLVVISGKQASFLVGGEIPIENTTTSASGGVQQTSTTYTQYGVNLSVTPTIHRDKIDVLLNVDIRDVDNSSSFSTNNNVAFVTRTASTDLLMDNRQTIVLAGLIKYADNVTVTEVPFLSKIPLLGALFRNKSIPNNSNTEMVIILTPTVLTDRKYAEKQTVYPTPQERGSWKEIESKYEHEPITSSWPYGSSDQAGSTTSLTGVVPPANDEAAGGLSALPAPVPMPMPAPEPLSAVTAYARMVQEKISKSIAYPAALTGNMGGTVKLRLRILKDGSLDSAQIVQSSGNYMLDQDAVQAAKTAAPYDAFGSSMEQNDLIFTIPIVYNKLMPAGQPPEKVVAAY